MGQCQPNSTYSTRVKFSSLCRERVSLYARDLSRERYCQEPREPPVAPPTVKYHTLPSQITDARRQISLLGNQGRI